MERGGKNAGDDRGRGRCGRDAVFDFDPARGEFAAALAFDGELAGDQVRRTGDRIAEARAELRVVFVVENLGEILADEIRAATAGGPELLTLGSARTRFTASDAVQSVLVLSSSPVERRLAQQAIEEYRDWEVETPKDALKWLADRGAQPLHHALTLLCAGAASELEWETFLAHHKKSYFAWVGPELPSAFKGNSNVIFLGPLAPEFLGEFKGGLAELFRSLRSDQPLPAAVHGHAKKVRRQ